MLRALPENEVNKSYWGGARREWGGRVLNNKFGGKGQQEAQNELKVKVSKVEK